MDLFKAEHKKLWSKISVKISVVLCFAYGIIFGSIFQYQWFAFGSSGDGTTLFEKHFDGYENIRKHQEYAGKYGSILNDESLSRMVLDYQESSEELSDWRTFNTWLQTLYPELKRSDMYQKLLVEYVDVTELTGLYEKRQKVINDLIATSGASEEEKEYLISMNDKVDTPFQYAWTEGWMTLLLNQRYYGIMFAIVLVISLSPLFSGEWHDRTGTMILSMKNGWKEDALAKVMVGFAFSLELFLIISIPRVIVQLILFGTSGWNMPIQNISMAAIAPMNMLQAEIYEYFHALLGIIGFAGVIMLISSILKNEMGSLLVGFAILFVPIVISKYLPYEIRLFSELFPLVDDSSVIFRTDCLNIFGKIIWMPYLQLLIPPLFGIVCIPATIKLWSKRMRA